MVLKRGKGGVILRGKATRQGAQERATPREENQFSSSEDSDPSTDSSESDSESLTSSDSSDESCEAVDISDKIIDNVQSLSLNKPKNAEKIANAQSQSKKVPAEMTRREREAMEKEQARQHYLKMKAKEDAERLAIIRKKREEDAARHAAEEKAREEARFNRR